MCIDPITLFAAGTAASGAAATGTAAAGVATKMAIGSIMANAVGGVISAAGAVQQGKATQKAAEATAQQQMLAAREEGRRGQFEAEKLSQDGARMIGQQKVAMAANGVDVNSRDAAALLESQRDALRADAFQIRENSQTRSETLQRQAANEVRVGRTARVQARVNAVGRMFDAAADVGSRYAWMRYQQG